MWEVARVVFAVDVVSGLGESALVMFGMNGLLYEGTHSAPGLGEMVHPCGVMSLRFEGWILDVVLEKRNHDIGVEMGKGWKRGGSDLMLAVGRAVSKRKATR